MCTNFENKDGKVTQISEVNKYIYKLTKAQ